MIPHTKKSGDDNTDHNHEESTLNPIATAATPNSSSVIDPPNCNATASTTSTNTQETTTPILEDPNPITHINTTHSATNNTQQRSKFVKPQADDVLCNEQIDITKCNAIKRIIHALEHYKLYHMTLLSDEASVIPLYEYISSLRNYDISMLMEDWYRCKKNHIKTRRDIQYFQKNEAINCHHTRSCVYVRRYQRDRYRGTTRDYRVKNHETDTKNIILMDILNSIHTFIFHWMPLQFSIKTMPGLSFDLDDSDEDSYKIVFEDDNDTKQDTVTKDQGEEEEETKQCEPAILWPNGPKPMAQCTAQEMAFLLKHEIVDRVAKLQAYKDDIAKYIEDNALDGPALSLLKRKQFAEQFVQLFDDTKLRMSFIKLHKHIWDYNDPQYVIEELVNEPVDEPIVMDNSKFVSTIANNSNHSELSYFSLGQQYRYTTHLQKHPLYVKPRFASLKEELACYFERDFFIKKPTHINKKQYCQTQMRDKFDVYVKTAHETLKRGSVKALKATWYHGLNPYHKISPKDVISIHHVLALVCYADNSELCTTLRKTYRSNTATESIEIYKLRHSYFAQFGKLLYESFVFYASTKDQVKILYHGVSEPMVFSSLQCAFDQPTSTSRTDSVANVFTKGTGIVLSFESCESCKYIRALDMSLFSIFSHEEEFLIFEARLRIRDLFIPTQRKDPWVGQHYMKALALYDMIIHGNTIHDKPLLNKTNQKRLRHILRYVMDDKISEISPSTYLNSFIEALMKKNKKIWLNIQQINALRAQLKQMFIAENNEFGIYIKYLQSTCNVVIYPIFRMCWKIDIAGSVGESFECMLSKGKTIVFRPHFTKVWGVFDVKMTLLKVYDDKPIKVHFNLECFELDGYFVSLHPRWMSVGANDSFDITLPSIDSHSKQVKAITLEMSIMIHNFEDFNIEYKDSDALNPKVMTQNMEHANMSYKCWDRLSWFYGFCNIVVSILDSISDISFIIFMWYYTDNHYFENDDQFQHENKITKFLAILSVGNLISIAIIIALYTTYQLVSFRFLFFLLFFILSPVLPAFEYLWGRLRKKHDIDNHIVVSLQYDGLLVWFKRELFRNKIFLIECVFESCFQIIIQFIAVFELKSLIYKDLYLYTSIIISLVVIISKLILCSYNMNRKRVWFNILCYFMDIFVSLLIAIFMGSVLFGNTVSFTGTYFIFEWLIFVLFGCYHIAQSLLVSYLAIPILILFCYPMTILSFSFFSMYPLFSYLAHKPMEIGKRKTFHSKLYDYCCDSKDQNEFNTKLIVANYVCIKSYFYQLRPGGPDERYYQFAKWLFEQNKSDLRHITLQTFRKKADNTAYHRVFTGITAIKSLQRFNPSTMVFAKAAQLSIRMIMVLVCLGLDTFQLKLFQNNQPFMQNYGDVLSLCGLIVMILFGIWFLFVAFESCNSKWNTFCSNMICSTHDKFVLMIPSDEFIKKCDRIMDNEEKYEMDDENQDIDMDPIINIDIKALPHHNCTERVVQFVQKYSKHSVYSLRLLSTIFIAAGVIAISYFVSDCLLYRASIALMYIRATMIISITLSVYAIYRGPSMIFVYGNTSHMVKATNFALYLSSIVFWIFTIYFKNDAQCQLQMTSLSLVGLLFIGSEFVIASLFWVLVIGFIGIPFMMLHVVYLCIRVCNERDDTPVDTERKLLLIGSPDSGVSTLFQTIKLFSDDDNLNVLLGEGRSAIRQNCVSGILTLLKQSQGLYDQAPQHNRECLVDLSDEVVNAIKLIVSYKSESFTRHLLYKELHELRNAIDMIWRLDS
eukprot:755436_1